MLIFLKCWLGIYLSAFYHIHAKHFKNLRNLSPLFKGRHTIHLEKHKVDWSKVLKRYLYEKNCQMNLFIFLIIVRTRSQEQNQLHFFYSDFLANDHETYFWTPPYTCATSLNEEYTLLENRCWVKKNSIGRFNQECYSPT